MPLKIKGFNLISKKYPSIKDQIKHWKIYPGDTVTILDGKDAGKTGKVIAQVKKLNAVMVENCNLVSYYKVHDKVVKHVKPNPEQVKGARITRESPIALSKVSLLDPSLNKPTDVELVKVFNPVKGKLEWNRISTLSQSLMPIPEKEDPFAKKEGLLCDCRLTGSRRKIGYQA